MDSMAWREQGACKRIDPELFFPVGMSGPALLQVAEAKSYCRSCPVVDECLAYALDIEIKSNYHGLAGIWGNTTRPERQHLLRTRSGKLIPLAS